jgi:glycosyltransferase involved in cell wall biosynthesis
MSSSNPRPLLLHVLHTDGPGGGSTCIRELLEMWEADFDQVLVTGGPGPLSRYCKSKGIPWHGIGPKHRLLLPLWSLRLLLLLRRIRPKVVILSGQWAGLAGAPVARLARIPVVIYVVHFSFLYTDTSLYRVVRNRVIELIPCALSTRVVVLSPGTHYQCLIRKLVDRARIRLIPNAIDADRVPRQDAVDRIRGRFGWDPDLCHVVSVGRLEDQKRVDWLLRSWALVEAASPTARLWIVGSGREEQALRRMARHLKLRHCVFMGSQPNGIEFIAAADVVAMTTLYEMHALVPLEAMACGKPIVASSAEGVRFSFTHEVEGLLVPPGDVNEFASALLMLIGDVNLRRKMGESGLEQAKTFSRDRMRSSYRSLFAELGIG